MHNNSAAEHRSGRKTYVKRICQPEVSQRNERTAGEGFVFSTRVVVVAVSDTAAEDDDADGDEEDVEEKDVETDESEASGCCVKAAAKSTAEQPNAACKQSTRYLIKQ